MRNDRDVCKKPEKRVRYMRGACKIREMRARYERCARVRHEKIEHQRAHGARVTEEA